MEPNSRQGSSSGPPAAGVQQHTGEEGVPQRPQHGEAQDGAGVLCEGPQGQEVAGIQDDGRQQAQEEELRVQHRRPLAHHSDQTSHQQTHHDQKTALGNHSRQTRDQVEA